MSSFESNNENIKDGAAAAAAPHPFCSLPGDPSLILTTNIDLGSNKNDIMEGKNCRSAWTRHPWTLSMPLFLTSDSSLFQGYCKAYWET